MLNRCAAARRPSAPNDRLEHEAGLVNENDDAVFSASLFSCRANAPSANVEWLPGCVNIPSEISEPCQLAGNATNPKGKHMGLFLAHVGLLKNPASISRAAASGSMLGRPLSSQ